MRLVLDTAEDAAHGDWLRATPGAYEWWYFDALSDDGEWALACIWFLGNPFSPYYRMASLKLPADPYAHNALFFALYRRGRLYAYHFTRFPADAVRADEVRPATLGFGPNELTYRGGQYVLRLADENANRRVLTAELRFEAPLLTPGATSADASADDHCWLPAAPACRVAGRLSLAEAQNPGAEQIEFRGQGYHDHNWGTLPFAAQIRDWYWARIGLGAGRALIVYHVDYRGQGQPVSHLLRFEDGQLASHDDQARVHLRRFRPNGFGTAHATCLDVHSGDLRARFCLHRRLDSSPFYVRALCSGEVISGSVRRSGQGLGEYFRPRILSWPVVASATKARIVRR